MAVSLPRTSAINKKSALLYSNSSALVSFYSSCLLSIYNNHPLVSFTLPEKVAIKIWKSNPRQTIARSCHENCINHRRNDFYVIVIISTMVSRLFIVWNSILRWRFDQSLDKTSFFSSKVIVHLMNFHFHAKNSLFISWNSEFMGRKAHSWSLKHFHRGVCNFHDMKFQLLVVDMF